MNDPKMYTKVKFAIDGEYDDNEIKTRLYGGCEKRSLCYVQNVVKLMHDV